ncbi:hypothetical protein PAPHI01_2080 [Pancytospora philotis]|nr:hypothetical protein PAPHI01_2080 [Pancytospora philotis]
MSNKFKHYRGQSEDEDSHNYIDDESEAMSLEEMSEPYEYSYRDALVDFLYSKRVLFTVIALLLCLTAVLLWKVNIDAVSELGGTKRVLLGKLLLVLGAGVGATVLLDYLLEKFSLRQLKRGRRNASLWFYINELSLYLSFGVAITALHAYMSIYLFNFYIETPYALKFYVYDLLRIGLLTTLVLAFQRVIVQNISMGFNYNFYISRIKKCILFDFFVSLINHLNGPDSDGAEQEAAPDDDGPAVLVGPHGNSRAFNTFIFQKKFRTRDAESLGLDARRVLLKAFQEMVKNTVSYAGSLPTILGKIRALSVARANKLVRKLIRTDKVEKIGDMRKYFADQEVFEYILEQLGLSRDEKVERSNIARIIEKAYKERYIIYKSIEQINAAIDKVALFVKACTLVVACIAVYLSALENKSSVTGVVSTIFGAQFVNRIISDNVVRSLLFLFVIHPFDIGDRVLITLNAVEENFVVAELNVFSTLFYRWDGTSVFIPNHILANQPITNIRRSGPTMETHSIQIDSATDPSKLYVLKQMLLEFVRANSEIYTDYVLVNYEKIENSSKLFVKVLIQYQSNLQNYESYLKKRSYFIIELNRALRSLDITYTLPAQRVKLSRAADEPVEKSALLKKSEHPRAGPEVI